MGKKQRDGFAVGRQHLPLRSCCSPTGIHRTVRGVALESRSWTSGRELDGGVARGVAKRGAKRSEADDIWTWNLAGGDYFVWIFDEVCVNDV